MLQNSVPDYGKVSIVVANQNVRALFTDVDELREGKIVLKFEDLAEETIG